MSDSEGHAKRQQHMSISSQGAKIINLADERRKRKLHRQEQALITAMIAMQIFSVEPDIIGMFDWEAIGRDMLLSD